MSDRNSEKQTVQIPEESQSQESVQATVQADSAAARTIRYMDDDTFRRSLDKVVNAHDRLLAKLAE